MRSSGNAGPILIGRPDTVSTGIPSNPQKLEMRETIAHLRSTFGRTASVARSMCVCLIGIHRALGQAVGPRAGFTISCRIPVGSVDSPMLIEQARKRSRLRGTLAAGARCPTDILRKGGRCVTAFAGSPRGHRLAGGGGALAGHAAFGTSEGPHRAMDAQEHQGGEQDGPPAAHKSLLGDQGYE